MLVFQIRSQIVPRVVSQRMRFGIARLAPSILSLPVSLYCSNTTSISSLLYIFHH